MNFISQWKAVFISLSVVASFFIVWDVYFTINGFWRFNSAYLIGVNILELPIEEWMFFFLIPYASFFIHYSLQYFYPQLKITQKLAAIITAIIIGLSLVLVLMNLQRSYTVVNFSVLAFVLTLGLLFSIKLLQQFYISFLVILIPFIFVNGILTGSFIENEVVWYNNNENLGVRFFTIPVEDFGYAFSLIFLNVFLIEKLRKKLKLPKLNKRTITS